MVRRLLPGPVDSSSGELLGAGSRDTVPDPRRLAISILHSEVDFLFALGGPWFVFQTCRFRSEHSLHSTLLFGILVYCLLEVVLCKGAVFWLIIIDPHIVCPGVSLKHLLCLYHLFWWKSFLQVRVGQITMVIQESFCCAVTLIGGLVLELYWTGGSFASLCVIKIFCGYVKGLYSSSLGDVIHSGGLVREGVRFIWYCIYTVWFSVRMDYILYMSTWTDYCVTFPFLLKHDCLPQENLRFIWLLWRIIPLWQTPPVSFRALNFFRRMICLGCSQTKTVSS